MSASLQAGERASPPLSVRANGIDIAGKSLARRKGFEPLTPRFEVWCSIQLSYRRPAPRGRIMARPKGFEPLTPRFVVWCSIQLSYGRVVTREAA